MATPSTISAFIAQAVSAGITEAGMVAALDYCIATQLSDDGRVVLSVGANGFQTTMSLEGAQRLRAYYREEVRKQAPPVTLSPQFDYFGSSASDFG